jgi:hypothetical protein
MFMATFTTRSNNMAKVANVGCPGLNKLLSIWILVLVEVLDKAGLITVIILQIPVEVVEVCFRLRVYDLNSMVVSNLIKSPCYHYSPAPIVP